MEIQSQNSKPRGLVTDMHTGTQTDQRWMAQQVRVSMDLVTNFRFKWLFGAQYSCLGTSNLNL